MGRQGGDRALAALAAQLQAQGKHIGIEEHQARRLARQNATAGGPQVVEGQGLVVSGPVNHAGRAPPPGHDLDRFQPNNSLVNGLPKT